MTGLHYCDDPGYASAALGHHNDLACSVILAQSARVDANTPSALQYAASISPPTEIPAGGPTAIIMVNVNPSAMEPSATDLVNNTELTPQGLRLAVSQDAEAVVGFINNLMSNYKRVLSEMDALSDECDKLQSALKRSILDENSRTVLPEVIKQSEKLASRYAEVVITTKPPVEEESRSIQVTKTLPQRDMSPAKPSQIPPQSDWIPPHLREPTKASMNPRATKENTAPKAVAAKMKYTAAEMIHIRSRVPFVDLSNQRGIKALMESNATRWERQKEETSKPSGVTKSRNMEVVNDKENRGPRPGQDVYCG